MNYFLVTIEFTLPNNQVVKLTNVFATYETFFTFHDIVAAGKRIGYEITKDGFSIIFTFKMTKKTIFNLGRFIFIIFYIV